MLFGERVRQPDKTFCDSKVARFMSLIRARLLVASRRWRIPSCMRLTHDSSHDSSLDSPRWFNEHSAVVLEALGGEGNKATSYQKLVEAVHRRQELLLSYNIGLDSDQRERDMNRRAASLVGLRMPDEHGDKR
jgi:hypothetical protein